MIPQETQSRERSAGDNVKRQISFGLGGEKTCRRRRLRVRVSRPPDANALMASPRFTTAFINIGNAGTVGSCPVHNPNYDFNDATLPIGASLFARLVEKKLPRLSGT
jgi:hypothetical protein